MRKAGLDQTKNTSKGLAEPTPVPPVKRIPPRAPKIMSPIDFLSHLNFGYCIALPNFDTTQYVTDTCPARGRRACPPRMCYSSCASRLIIADLFLNSPMLAFVCDQD